LTFSRNGYTEYLGIGSTQPLTNMPQPPAPRQSYRRQPEPESTQMFENKNLLPLRHATKDLPSLCKFDKDGQLSNHEISYFSPIKRSWIVKEKVAPG
jgi:hypothetical protein